MEKNYRFIKIYKQLEKNYEILYPEAKASYIITSNSFHQKFHLLKNRMRKGNIPPTPPKANGTNAPAVAAATCTHGLTDE